MMDGRPLTEDEIREWEQNPTPTPPPQEEPLPPEEVDRRRFGLPNADLLLNRPPQTLAASVRVIETEWRALP